MGKISVYFLLIFCVGTLHAGFDFGMKVADAEKILSEYYQIQIAPIPDDQLERIKSGGSGWFDYCCKLFSTVYDDLTKRKKCLNYGDIKKTEEDLTITDELAEKIYQTTINSIAVHQYLFNKYNELFNQSNMFEQAQPLQSSELQEALDAWTDKDLLNALTVTDAKTKKPSGIFVNNYFNNISEIVDASLDRLFFYPQSNVVPTQLEVLEKIITQWYALPPDNKKKLLQALKANPNNIIKMHMKQKNISPQDIYKHIKKKFNDNKNNPKKQARYVFFAELIDAIFKKDKQGSFKEAVNAYLNPKNDSQRTYQDLINEMDDDPAFFYKTFGSINDVNLIMQWMHEARLGKKKKEIDVQATEDYEKNTGKKKTIYKNVMVEKDGVLVPVYEKPDPELYKFLTKVVEYNPILYVQNNNVLKSAYIPPEDVVEDFANALATIV